MKTFKVVVCGLTWASVALSAQAYTVQFYDAGNQVGSNQSVANGRCATVPTSPTFSTYKAGKQFIGWVARKAGIKAFACFELDARTERITPILARGPMKR